MFSRATRFRDSSTPNFEGEKIMKQVDTNWPKPKAVLQGPDNVFYQIHLLLITCKFQTRIKVASELYSKLRLRL